MGNEIPGRKLRHYNAIRRGIKQKDMVRVRHLLESSTSDCPVHDSLILEIACHRGDYEMVELVLNYGEFPKNRRESRVLDMAVWMTKNNIAELLIQYGFDCNGRNQFDETLLYVAACANNAIITNTLIRLGLNVDDMTRTWTPLHVAAQRNHTDVIKVLLWNGCDMEIKNSDLNTPAMLTIAQYKPCSLLIVDLFLKAGAKITLDDLESRQVAQRYPEVEELVHNDHFCAKPLTDLCRGVIRMCIGRRIPERALTLSLPKFLQYFVRMDDVFVSDLPIS